MSLAALQRDFMGGLLDEDLALPPVRDARFAQGFAIYRNAYRARLVAALEETFPRTARWVGEEAFAAAAAHHLIVHPPFHWTLDEVGRGFDATLAELFANDPEVTELAWLEWAMHDAFTTADAAPIDLAAFGAASAGFGDDDWNALRFTFVPSLRLAGVRHDCIALWRALDGDHAPETAPQLDSPAICVVWREGLEPVFRLAEEREGRALLALNAGATYGEACTRLAARLGEEVAAREAGVMLARWLALGLIAHLEPCIPREIR